MKLWHHFYSCYNICGFFQCCLSGFISLLLLWNKVFYCSIDSAAAAGHLAVLLPQQINKCKKMTMAIWPLHVTSFPWRSLLQGAITVFKETHYFCCCFPTLAECMVKFNVSLVFLLHSYFPDFLLLTCRLLIILMCFPQHVGKHFCQALSLWGLYRTNKHIK